MNRAFRIIQRRSQAKKILADLFDHGDNAVVIHYSCESFYDRQDGSSPRITSIAVRNLESAQTASFSIHQIAERNKVPRESIEQRYDDLEKKMLDEFYEYIRVHAGYRWLHWNMRNANYGFQALAHRLEVLGGEPIEIQESSLFDISRVLVAIYGIAYIGHPRLRKLIDKNDISDKDFLEGEDEAVAFREKEYVKLHQSTLKKVDVLANIAERANDGILKTNTNWVQVYGIYPEAIGDFLKDHWWVSILSSVHAKVVRRLRGARPGAHIRQATRH